MTRTLVLAALSFAEAACSGSPAPDAGLPAPPATRSVHVPPTGCTLIVIDRADGSEQDVCLSAADLQQVIDARTKAGRN